MKEAYSTKEMMELLGVSKPTVFRRAEREGWQSQPRQDVGGGKEWLVSSMPESTRESLYSNAVDNLPAVATKNEIVVAQEPVKRDLNSLKKWQRDCFEARLVLFREFEKLQTLFGTTKAWKKMVKMAETETFPEHLQQYVSLANARKGSNRTLSKSMILGWQRKVNEGGIEALAPVDVEQRKVPPWAPYFLKCYNRPQKPSLSQAREDLKRVLPENLEMPSYHQLRRWQNKRHAIDAQRGRHSAQSLKQFKGHIRRSTEKLLPGDIGQIDGHSVKMRVAHPEHGRPFHPEVCGVVDWRTRVCTGWSAWLSESAWTVSGAIINSLIVNENKPYGGTYAMIYADKGSGNKADIVSKKITGVTSRCGTEFHFGLPGNSQGRGLIEVSNKSLWINMAKKSITYTGKDMDSKKAREIYLVMDREVKKTGTCTNEQLPTWNQFLQMCQQTVDEYNRRPHRGLPKITDPHTGRRRHMAPLEMWVQHLSEGWTPSILPKEVVADMSRPQMIRKARRCEVSLFGNRYYSSDLEGYHGHEVIVECDVHDARAVKVRDINQRLICEAIWNANVRDAYPVSIVEKNRNERAERRMKLVDHKRDEILDERQGTVELHHDAMLIDIDEAAVARQLNQDSPTTFLDHTPIEAGMPLFTETKADPLPATVVEPQKIKTPTPMYCASGTLTEMYLMIKEDLEVNPRPLSQHEYDTLCEFYETDNGRLFLSIDEDLREIAGRAYLKQARP